MMPRLLTEKAAADYLSLPVAGVRKIVAGRVVLDGRVRWDKVALDEWLDSMAGKVAPNAANQNLSAPDAALAGWLADQTNAPRRT